MSKKWEGIAHGQLETGRSHSVPPEVMWAEKRRIMETVIIIIMTICCTTIASDNISSWAHMADIVLIIDQSGSIGAQNYEEEIDFAQQFVSSFPVSEEKTRVALIEFSLANMTRVRLNWKDGTDLQRVRSKLDEMRHAQLGTGTDFGKALMVANQLQTVETGDRPDAPNVAVLITDGYLNSKHERNPTFEAAQSLRRTGVLLYAIHVKLDPAMKTAPIQDLVEMTGSRSRVFAADDFKRLTDQLLKQITQQISREYGDCLFEFEPTGQCYRNSTGPSCVQDAYLKIIREPQSPDGRACPADTTIQIECSPELCHDSCEKWAWGDWGDCVSETCGINGTKTRHRHGNAPYPKLATTCPLIETRPCTKDELEVLKCADGRMAENVKGADAYVMPVWAILLIVMACLSILGAIIGAVILYRSPKWRIVFVPTKPRRNQLPGNTAGDAASTTSL